MAAHSAQNRRRYPRLEVLGRVEGQLMPVEAPLVVRDLSRGGFSAETQAPFTPGTVHLIRFTSRHSSVELSATAVHCRLGPVGDDGRHSFVTGFEFVADAGSREAIGKLVDTLSAALASA
jgi:hypothetical protein